MGLTFWFINGFEPVKDLTVDVVVSLSVASVYLHERSLSKSDALNVIFLKVHFLMLDLLL